jgi:hypothetical protein
MTAMQGDMRSRAGILVGLGAATACFGAAAMLSTTTAPTARADAYSDIIASVDGDYALGQTDFTTAATYLGSNLPVGLALLLDGVNEDSVAAPDNLLVGTVEALTNEPIATDFSLSLPVPTDFADGVTTAQTIISSGESLLSDVAPLLSAGEYGSAVYYDLLGSEELSVFPLQELLLGAVASF